MRKCQCYLLLHLLQCQRSAIKLFKASAIVYVSVCKCIPIFFSADWELQVHRLAVAAFPIHLKTCWNMMQIGQVMLALPHAVNNCGMRAAIPLITVYTLASMWTIHLLTSLYVDNKARKVCDCIRKPLWLPLLTI